MTPQELKEIEKIAMEYIAKCSADTEERAAAGVEVDFNDQARGFFFAKIAELEHTIKKQHERILYLENKQGSTDAYLNMHTPIGGI